MSNYATFPIVRLEIEHMKHQVLVALAEYQVQLDESIKAAVESSCTKENIDIAVRRSVAGALQLAVEEALASTFKFGPGREMVNEIVRRHIKTLFETQREG